MLNFATYYVAFFALLAGMGTPTLLTREIARDHSLVGRYVSNVVVLKLVLIAVLVGRRGRPRHAPRVRGRRRSC